jgi:hypothetical protein
MVVIEMPNLTSSLCFGYFFEAHLWCKTYIGVSAYLFLFFPFDHWRIKIKYVLLKMMHA